MNIGKITGAFALTLAVSTLPAMAINTRGQADPTWNQPAYPYGQSQDGRFKGMDRNGDGIITRDEWRGNDKSFEKHDRNRDGVISAADRTTKKAGKAKHREKRDDRDRN